MTSLPIFTLLADTLLVRPVAVPAPWYSVASGVLSIVVTLLLLGIALALLGMLRAVKGVEHRLTGRMQGLADELIPLARNLNGIATQLSEVTRSVQGDLNRLSRTVGAVDTAVRDVIDDGHARLAQFGTLLDVVQEEAEGAVSSARGLLRGVRAGTGSLFADMAGRKRAHTKRRATSRHSDLDDTVPQSDADVLARLAALEAAFRDRSESAWDDDDDIADSDASALRRHAAARVLGADPLGDDEEEDEDEDELYAFGAVAEEDELDDDDDDEPDEAEMTHGDDDGSEPEPDDAPRGSGPRIRPRRR